MHEYLATYHKIESRGYARLSLGGSAGRRARLERVERRRRERRLSISVERPERLVEGYGAVIDGQLRFRRRGLVDFGDVDELLGPLQRRRVLRELWQGRRRPYDRRAGVFGLLRLAANREHYGVTETETKEETKNERKKSVSRRAKEGHRDMFMLPQSGVGERDGRRGGRSGT